MDKSIIPHEFEYPQDRAQFYQPSHHLGIELYRAHIIHHSFSPHTHEAYGIGVIKAGVERFRYRGSEYLASPGSIILMNPEELHTGKAETKDGWYYQMAYINVETIEHLIGEKTWWFSEVLQHHILTSHHISTLLDSLWTTHEPLQFDSILFLLLTQCRHYANHSQTYLTKKSMRFQHVIDYMKAHLACRLTLNELANIAQLSPYHFLRTFQAQHHATPHQMLMALRLFEAKCLLANKISPAQVATMTGLADQSHLTRVFFNHYGITPAHYQRQVCC